MTPISGASRIRVPNLSVLLLLAWMMSSGGRSRADTVAPGGRGAIQSRYSGGPTW